MKNSPEMIYYKDALTKVAPNMDQDDPIRANWIVRKNGTAADAMSKMTSRMSFVSTSPSKISIRSINGKVPAVVQRPKEVPPIKKLVPAETTSRHNSQATADTTVVGRE